MAGSWRRWNIWHYWYLGRDLFLPRCIAHDSQPQPHPGMEKLTVILAFLSVYFLVNYFWQAKGATAENATNEVIKIGDSPIRSLTFQFRGYPERVFVHDRKLVNHHRKLQKYMKNRVGVSVHDQRLPNHHGKEHKYMNNKSRASVRKLLKHHGKGHRFMKNMIPAGPRGKYGTSVVVAKDGTGQVSSIFQAAEIANFNRNINTRFHIHVKAGIYDETIEIKRPNVLLTGDGMDKTFIKGRNRAIEGKVTTSKSATFVVSGAGFMARDITFENYAGPHVKQAVALRASTDSFFYKCRFKGYQETLYLQNGRQFYRDCEISGTVDFIFGDATAVLQNCHIIVRTPLNGHPNTITAQGRNKSTSKTGFVIQNSRITAEPELRQARGAIKTYLGRQWGPFSRTVFMNSDLGDFIDAGGWRAWDGGKNSVVPDTTYYGEFNNRGGGADTRGRRRWKGYHLLTVGEAAQFTVRRFLSVRIPREIPVS